MINMRDMMLVRDLMLMHTFLDHLHKTSALSVPPEDLVAAVDDIAVRFRFAESGGPGYEELKHLQDLLITGANVHPM